MNFKGDDRINIKLFCSVYPIIHDKTLSKDAGSKDNKDFKLPDCNNKKVNLLISITQKRKITKIDLIFSRSRFKLDLNCSAAPLKICSSCTFLRHRCTVFINLLVFILWYIFSFLFLVLCKRIAA